MIKWLVSFQSNLSFQGVQLENITTVNKKPGYLNASGSYGRFLCPAYYTVYDTALCNWVIFEKAC